MYAEQPSSCGLTPECKSERCWPLAIERRGESKASKETKTPREVSYYICQKLIEIKGHE